MRVSVVIPSFNHARFIGEALGSVLSTGAADLEVVLVDDGSTDDTLEVVQAFASDERLSVHAQSNRGAHEALNVGVSLAGGELVFILNSDDIFEPQRIPRLTRLFEADPQLMVAASWLTVVDEIGSPIGVKRGASNMPPWPPPRRGPRLVDLGDPHLALLEQNWAATTSNLALRRSLFADLHLRFLPLRYAHDWELLLSACSCGGLALVEEPLVRYRVHGANTILEGQERDEGRGLMRFEILWLLARHAMATLAVHEARGRAPADLRPRLWRSLPRFGCDEILHQLLVLRGDGAEPPAAFDALLRPDHPFRLAAVQTLSRAPG